jgi:uncharacterized repeat protein (TIGR03803 family)
MKSIPIAGWFRVLTLGLVIPALQAQPLVTLHYFSQPTSSLYTNSDGAYPVAGLVLSDNRLYGAAFQGGTAGNGAVYAINLNGTGFSNLHNFSPFATDITVFALTNADGYYPFGGLVLSGNQLYGTPELGGRLGQGIIFGLNLDGSGFTSLYNFTGGSEGSFPYPGVAAAGGKLYGCAIQGGGSANGTVFSIDASGGTPFVIHTFSTATGTPATNNDGIGPSARLLVAGNLLYGTTVSGGASGSGTLFSLSTGSGAFSNLYNFSASLGTAHTNSDGSTPTGTLLLLGDRLYGTARQGGSSGSGTVFSVLTNGSGFSVLHTFTAMHGSPATNDDGAAPQDGLTASGDTLYGTAPLGGPFGGGTLFSINTDGSRFMILYQFTATTSGTNLDGFGPNAGLILSGNKLYGTTVQGGTGGVGTVFSLTLPGPQLNIADMGANAILSWSTNFSGYTLEFTTNLAVPAFWDTNQTTPAVVGEENVVTDAISTSQKFYRLIGP